MNYQYLAMTKLTFPRIVLAVLAVAATLAVTSTSALAGNRRAVLPPPPSGSTSGPAVSLP